MLSYIHPWRYKKNPTLLSNWLTMFTGKEIDQKDRSRGFEMNQVCRVKSLGSGSSGLEDRSKIINNRALFRWRANMHILRRCSLCWEVRLPARGCLPCLIWPSLPPGHCHRSQDSVVEMWESPLQERTWSPGSYSGGVLGTQDSVLCRWASISS